MDIHQQIADLKRNNSAFVLATVVKTGGSTPGKTGFKLVYKENGETVGTVGGGAIEETVISECKKRLKEDLDNALLAYMLSADENAKAHMIVVPMSCKGTMSVFYEIYKAQENVYIFGGGHVGHALLYYLKPLPFNTVLVDNRKEFANHEKNPNADKIIHEDYNIYVETFNPHSNSYFIVLTHGHEFDLEIAKTIFSRRLKHKYLGIIASRKKSEKIRKALQADFGKEIDLKTLSSPVGLKIGGDSAEEIAVSIAAELIKIKHQN